MNFKAALLFAAGTILTVALLGSLANPVRGMAWWLAYPNSLMIPDHTIGRTPPCGYIFTLPAFQTRQECLKAWKPGYECLYVDVNKVCK